MDTSATTYNCQFSYGASLLLVRGTIWIIIIAIDLNKFGAKLYCIYNEVFSYGTP